MLPEHTTRKMKIKLQVRQVISKLGRSLWSDQSSFWEFIYPRDITKSVSQEYL